MGKAAIFAGSFVRVLKNNLRLGTAARLLTGSDNPTSVAKDAEAGSLLLRTGSDGGRLFRKVDAGSSTNWVDTESGTRKNYILNHRAEASIEGWATYADAAGTEPVDGTGGAANITLSRNTTSPITSIADFDIAKDAVNRQGEGVSYDITIDSADAGKEFELQLDFTVSANYLGGDVRVFVYDVTNSELLLEANSDDQLYSNGLWRGRFLTNSTSTSYRVILHISGTNASAWDLNFSNVSFKPFEAVFGPDMRDAQEYTPTITGFGTATNVRFRWKKIGDEILIQGIFTSGTTTAVEAQVSFPPGLETIAELETLSIAGVYFRSGGAFSDKGGPIIVEPSTAYMTFGHTSTFGSASVDPLTKRNGSQICASGDEISVEMRIPIDGWKTNSVTTNSTYFSLSSVVANGTRVTATPAAVGEYRTLIKDNAARTVSDDAPTQTGADIRSNGMRVFAPSGSGAGTSGQPNRWIFFVGKDKHVSFRYYRTSGRTGWVDTDYFFDTAERGLKHNYDPTTGILDITVPIIGASATRYVGSSKTSDTDEMTNQSDCYFDVIVSDTAVPVQSGPRTLLFVHTRNGYGSSGTRIRRFLTVVENYGDDFTYTDDATDGHYITINRDGVYSFTYSDGVNINVGFSLNSTQLSTNIDTITAADRLCNELASNSNYGTVSVTLPLKRGDVIRAHSGGTSAHVSSERTSLIACRVS